MTSSSFNRFGNPFFHVKTYIFTNIVFMWVVELVFQFFLPRNWASCKEGLQEEYFINSATAFSPLCSLPRYMSRILSCKVWAKKDNLNFTLYPPVHNPLASSIYESCRIGLLSEYRKQRWPFHVQPLQVWGSRSMMNVLTRLWESQFCYILWCVVFQAWT